MDADWIKSPGGRRVAELWADPRPAWLWSQDSQTLFWRNRAARLFLGKIRKRGLKLAPELTPIRGQVARIIRLGAPGRSSLSRIQFLAGEKPVSVTCACVPLLLENGQTGLLIAGVDPVEAELLAADLSEDALSHGVLAEDTEYLVAGPDGEITGGSPEALRRFAPEMAAGDVAELAVGESVRIAIGGAALMVTRLKASGDGASLLLFAAAEAAPEMVAEPTAEAEAPVAAEAEAAWYEPAVPDEAPRQEDYLTADWFEPELHVAEALVAEESVEGDVVADRRLSTLFDRLASDEELYKPLADEPEVPEPVAEAEIVPAAVATVAEEKPTLFKVIGRGFAPIAAETLEEAAEPEAETLEAAEPEAPADAEVVERVSRYNFDELGRILTDRIGNDANNPSNHSTAPAASIEAIIAASAPPAPPPVSMSTAMPPPATTGALVNLGGETLVLNRLPLGILVFRDQQVLFANRAITEMTGYDSVEALRNAGLAAIFPASDGAQEAGPVNHIVQRGGALVPVTARLQSISWQGRPALMLSASATEVRTGHEVAVRAFAEALAEARGDGFIETTRNGVISLVSAQGRMALDKPEQQLLGRPLLAIIDPADSKALQEFLDRPARFAETARPCLSIRSGTAGVDLLLFAQGQAGIVTGYFGFTRQREPAPRTLLAATDRGESEPALLGRLSRSVRRPLNTIIGFSDLIRTAAFGAIDNPRYLEYAQDIKTAGHEIAALVDELDDYTRLKDGRYAPRQADLDLAALLDSCVTRIRGQAGAARVLVRSAISERLPKVTADRASLGQAVLNLLASAIDQTPVGGSVVLSAQLEDDGSVSVHVRDSAATMGDLSERFVVFRDGVGRNGEALAPVRSSVGLALTRSLLAVNAFSLSVAPTGGTGTLFSLVIPPTLVAKA